MSECQVKYVFKFYTIKMDEADIKTEDDMVLVIVEDEPRDGYEEIVNKFEKNIEEECDVENMIETAAKHGHFIDIKVEPAEEEDTWSQIDYDYCDIKTENEDYENFDDDDDGHQEQDSEPFEDVEYLYDDEEYLPPNDIDIKLGRGQRRSLLRPDEQKSFVNELREQYPELRKNTKKLVNAVSEIMRGTKPPKPPKGSFVKNGNYRECTLCNCLSESLPAAERHYQEKHGQRYLICFACGVDFRSKTNLYKHEKRCISSDATIVLKARASLLGNKARSRPYINHYKNKPPRVFKSNKKFQCSECSATFTVQKTLDSHMNLHKGLRPYRCKTCPAAYTSPTALSRHEKKHLDVQYICDHCGRAFKIKEALIPHLDTHKPYRKFGCHLCDRRYAQKAALQLHIDRVHRNLPPPCACPVCPKRFPRMSLLKTHMMSEHGLNIMTRKMFFKKLPTLSESEMKQVAKVMLKKDVESVAFGGSGAPTPAPTGAPPPAPAGAPPPAPARQPPPPAPDQEYIAGEEIVIPETLSRDEMIDFLKNLDTGGDKTQVFVIKNGDSLKTLQGSFSDVI